jgi:hypothetical protein
MHRPLTALLLLAAATLASPGRAEACCMAEAAHLVWPWDGMEGLPVDTALVIYGAYYFDLTDAELEWTLDFHTAEGEAVPFTAVETEMGGDYFLLVVTPDEPLLPDSTYAFAFSRSGGEVSETPLERTFTTGTEGAEWAEPPAISLDYQGVGVAMDYEDGSSCISSVTEEEGALALWLSGEGFDALPVLIEVKDSGGDKVFDMLLPSWGPSGEGDLYAQQIIGGDLCRAHFPLDGCEHYCVRAAALVHTGAPGPWTDWQCSSDIGFWECGDPYGQVFFGDDIPEGIQSEKVIEACLGQSADGSPETDRQPDDATFDGPKGNDAAPDDSAGCTAGRSASAASLALLAALFLLLTARRKAPLVVTSR